MTLLDEALNTERRRTHEARSLARELLGLIANGEMRHPGEPSHRSHWISDRKITEWRNTVRAWLDDIDLPPKEHRMDTALATPDEPEPTTNRLRLHTKVHYVAYGTPAGEYPSTCRAATVAEVGGWRTITENVPARPAVAALRCGGEPVERVLHQVWDAEVASLHVTNPTGIFLNEAPHDEHQRLAGTWHFPDNCDQ